MLAGRGLFSGQPPRFVAEDPGGRLVQIKLGQGCAGHLRRAAAQRIFSAPGDNFSESNVSDDREVKDAADASAYRLGVRDVDGIVRDDDSVCPEGIRAPDDRAEVTGVADLRADRDEHGLRGQFLQRAGPPVADCDDALRGHRIAELADLLVRRARQRRSRYDDVVEPRKIVCDDDQPGLPSAHRLPDSLRTLSQKLAVLTADLAAQ